jgi:hypothetical protein
MAEKIGFQNGVLTAALREKELHPQYTAAWDKRARTLGTLIEGHNETQDRLSKLEAAVAPLFP